jgi:hypothetical protein
MLHNQTASRLSDECRNSVSRELNCMSPSGYEPVDVRPHGFTWFSTVTLNQFIIRYFAVLTAHDLQ